MTETAVEDETERFRQLVIASTSTPRVGPTATASVETLNGLYARNRATFTAEDIRWLNVLRGLLGVRLAAHQPKVEHERRAKRRGDSLDHCWRCETPIDERFDAACAACSDRSYRWRVCPVCQACGCQRSGRVLL